MIEYNKEITISKSLVNGYQYFCDSHHPLSTKEGWVYYHRHVISIKEGRWILSEEHVHHIDGNKLNNDPSNLILMSRKEHSILECQIKGYFIGDFFCEQCGKKLERHTLTGLCEKCVKIYKRKFNPTKEELFSLVWEMPMTNVAKLFNVSDKAIKKRCKLFLIETPPRGYWLKFK